MAGADVPYVKNSEVSMVALSSAAVHESDSSGKYTTTRLPCFTVCRTLTVGMGLESLRVLGTAGQRQILQQMKHVLASLKANFTENGNDTAHVQPCWHVSIDTTTYALSWIMLSRSFWHQAVPPALLWVHAPAPAPPCQVDKSQV